MLYARGWSDACADPSATTHDSATVMRRTSECWSCVWSDACVDPSATTHDSVTVMRRRRTRSECWSCACLEDAAVEKELAPQQQQHSIVERAAARARARGRDSSRPVGVKTGGRRSIRPCMSVCLSVFPLWIGGARTQPQLIRMKGKKRKKAV